jgi:hypothetical protein
MITGMVILAFGVVLLLGQMGVVNIHTLWRLWPLSIVFSGVMRLQDAHSMSHRVWGVVLICIGGLTQANCFGMFPYGIDKLWPLFIVGGGLSLILQSYEGKEDVVGMPGSANGNLNSFNVFGGTERRLKIKNFRGGQLFAVFGGFDIDLSESEIEGDTAVIDATAIFGGGQIRVPASWTVDVQGIGIFGGYEDSTRHMPFDGMPLKTLIVKGAAVFGGVEVKN